MSSSSESVSYIKLSNMVLPDTILGTYNNQINFQYESSFIRKQNSFIQLIWRFLHQATGSLLKWRSAHARVFQFVHIFGAGGCRMKGAEEAIY